MIFVGCVVSLVANSQYLSSCILVLVELRLNFSVSNDRKILKDEQ